jgi:hypothetical protein
MQAILGEQNMREQPRPGAPARNRMHSVKAALRAV